MVLRSSPQWAMEPRMLSQAVLEHLVAVGEIDTVLLAFSDMQGRLHRQTGVGAAISSTMCRARRRVLQLPAGRRRRHEHRRRLRDVGLGDGLRRPGDVAGPRHPAAACRGCRAPRWCWATCCGLTATRCPSRAAQYPLPPARPARRARPGALRRHRARVHRLQRHSSGKPGTRLHRPRPRPTTTTSTTRCSAPTRMEPLLRDIRLGMEGAGLYCEGARASATSASRRSRSATTRRRTTCDNHSIYKNGAKEIASQHGKSLTFMAKFDEREGNSCHIHFSLRGDDGAAVFADSDDEPACRRCSAASSPVSSPLFAS